MFGYAGGISADGPSPSGKAQDFDSCIRGFESRWPSDEKGSENDCFQNLFLRVTAEKISMSENGGIFLPDLL